MRFLRIFTVSLVALIALIQSTEVAHADPHAMFYTAVGQQQLFFNMLAALDQADFVEPADGAANFSRETLLNRRSDSNLTDEHGHNVSFGRETDPRVTSTKTDLSSILTRNITLEGNDVWTAYLVFQFSLEAARRNDTDQVIRVFCQRGLGPPNCGDQTTGEEILEGKERAYVTDPLKRSAEIITNGVQAALFSDTNQGSLDQQIRRSIDSEQSEGDPQRPYAFDSSVAALRSNNFSAGDPVRNSIVDRFATSAINAFGPQGVDADALNSLNIDSAGRATVASNAESSTADTGYIKRYTTSVADLLNIGPSFMNVANTAASKIVNFQQTEQQQGALGDTKAVSHYANGTTSEESDDNNAAAASQIIGDIDGKISVPAHAKIAFTQEAVNAISNTAQNLQYARPEAEAERGICQLVNRSNNPPECFSGNTSVAGSTTSYPAPENKNVLGVSTTTPKTQGLVLGITGHDNEPATAEDYEEEKPSLDPNVNATSFINEQGSVHLLEILGYYPDGLQDEGCEGTCNTEGILESYWGSIIDWLNSL